jgi:hypothetical protein
VLLEIHQPFKLVTTRGPNAQFFSLRDRFFRECGLTEQGGREVIKYKIHFSMAPSFTKFPRRNLNTSPSERTQSVTAFLFPSAFDESSIRPPNGHIIVRDPLRGGRVRATLLLRIVEHLMLPTDVRGAAVIELRVE